MSKYTFPNIPIIPRTRFRTVVDEWCRNLKKHNLDSFKLKTFGEVVDQAILEDVIKEARKENDKEEIKEFLDQFSTKIGEEE